MSFNINLFTPAEDSSDSPGSSANVGATRSRHALGMVACPNCGGDLGSTETVTAWQTCFTLGRINL